MNASQTEETQVSCTVLKDAWQKFWDYDMNAQILQKSFKKVHFWLLLLGCAATLLALLYTQLVDISKLPMNEYLKKVLHFVVLLTPITISILVAAANYFKPGKKWIFLRRAAEDIKCEIFRFRTLHHLTTGDATENWIDILRQKINQTGSWLMGTEVSQMAIKECKIDTQPHSDTDAEKDDLFSDMQPEQYIKFRLEDQLHFYSGKTKKFEKVIKHLQWLIFAFGGIGTFLAAIGLEMWVALATSLGGAFTTYLEYRQMESSLMFFNQGKISLEGIRGWWSDLTDSQKKDPRNIRKMVDATEQALQSELSKWAQNMQTTLDSLMAKYKEEEKERK
ncbi:MAG: hypothetical protein QG657_3749 [Acidobacteriota bacterium]|nr:hypothetical protein [Acidobacteriota bacterium]